MSGSAHSSSRIRPSLRRVQRRRVDSVGRSGVSFLRASLKAPAVRKFSRATGQHRYGRRGAQMLIVIAAWVAAVLVFSSFFMKTMIRLRVVAITSNVAFVAYGLLGLNYGVFDRTYAILVLH